MRLNNVPRELRLALRRLRRAPGYTVTSISILALGIGLAAAIFTIADAVLVRPLPEHAPERIVLPRTQDASGTDVSMSPAEMKELAADSHTLSDVAGIAHMGAFLTTLIDGDRTISMRLTWVTGNFFRVLGARPALGSFFTTKDEARGSATAAVMVLSYAAWQREFGGDSSVIGHQLTNPYTLTPARIIGVAPPGLAYPVGTDYWTPQVYVNLDAVARLAPGATVSGARSEFFSIMRQIGRARAGEDAGQATIAHADIETLTHAVLGDVRPELLVLSAAVALLLLIACVNVGNLILLRVTSRDTEIAVRRSLGARRTDIVRPLLIEGAVTTLVGGALGWALARAGIAAFTRLAPPDVPRLDVVRLAGAPLAWAAGLTLVTLVLATVIPTLLAARGGVAAQLRSDARVGAGHSRRRLRQALVASQVALALILLAGTGLLIRSLDRLAHVPLGYQPHHLAILIMTRPVTADSGPAQMTAMYDLAAPRFRAIPGVESVTPVNADPFHGPQVFVARWAAEGQSDAAAQANPFIGWEVGGTEYFRTFDIPLLRGRGFEKSDVEGAPRVVVVSRSVAERFWPGENPIGKRLRYVGGTAPQPWMTVVGEAGDIRYRDVREATPSIYVPWRQLFFQGIVAIRTSGSLASVLPQLRNALHDVVPQARIARAVSMDGLIGEQLALPRLSTLLISALGAAALLLAAIGLYGVMAAAVREEAHDLGIRAALGATPGRLRGEVLRRAGTIAMVGGAVGLAAALLVSRFLRALLYQVSPTDPLALLGACGVLLIVALAAAYVPAWRATRVDPMRVLRTE